jgi:competence protein ComEA
VHSTTGGRFNPGVAPGAALLSTALMCCTALCAEPPAGSTELLREAKSLQAVCGKCHNLQIVMNTPRSLDDWRDTMQKMVDLGASGTDDQYDDILDYLHRTMTTIDVNSAAADELAIVLNAAYPSVKLIIARRINKKFVDLSDLKTIPGLDAATLDAKSKLIYFQ